MRQLWRIISEFDVEGVILLLGIVTLFYGLIVFQVPPETRNPVLDFFNPQVVGAVMSGAGLVTVVTLGMGNRILVLTSIPVVFACWCLLLATTLFAAGPRTTPLVAATLFMFALGAAWTWIRILVDPGRIRAHRLRQWS